MTNLVEIKDLKLIYHINISKEEYDDIVAQYK